MSAACTVALITHKAPSPSLELVWLPPTYQNSYSTVVLPADDLGDGEVVSQGGSPNCVNAERGDQELDTVPTISEESIVQDIIFDQGDDDSDSIVIEVSQLPDIYFTTALPVSSSLPPITYPFY